MHFFLYLKLLSCKFLLNFVAKIEIGIGIGERDTYLEEIFGSTLNSVECVDPEKKIA